jgi:23S rRNA (cytosine1962-C5)-methyltransferase
VPFDRRTLETVRLPASLAATLRASHPWVYKNHVPPTFKAKAGWVRVVCGGVSAYAIWDPESALALRIYARGEFPDAAWITARIAEAWQLREVVRATDTTAYRLISGEGDRLPGIVVDLYGELAVVVLDSPALEPLLPDVIDRLRKVARLRGIFRKQRGEATKPEIVWGAPPKERLIVTENGLRFLANLTSGQKTGLFLDHRDNRAFVERLARGKRVLNLFAYSGAFSLYAARGGATSVVSVDVAAAAIEDARRNFELNELASKTHDFVVADVFDYLQAQAKAKERFDLVIVDPPSLARSIEQVKQATRAYVRLNTLAATIVDDGGTLVTASCTARISPEDFQRIVAEAGNRANRSLQLFHTAGHAADHPIAIGHSEGRYLKFLACRVLEPV